MKKLFFNSLEKININNLRQVNESWKKFDEEMVFKSFLLFELKTRIDNVLFSGDMTPEEKSGAVNQLISFQDMLGGGRSVVESAIRNISLKEGKPRPDMKPVLSDDVFKDKVMKTK